MKASEVRELSTDDLNEKLSEARAELFNLRFQMATSQLDNTARVKTGQERHRAYSAPSCAPARSMPLPTHAS